MPVWRETDTVDEVTPVSSQVRQVAVAAACVVAGLWLVAAGRGGSGVLALGIGLGILLMSGWHWWASRSPRLPAPPGDAMYGLLVEALATAIDAKHDPAGSRLQRRRSHGTALARAVELPPAEIEAVRTAALLLDIGQLAVPDHILARRGPLSVEEFHKIRIHPQVSADLIAGVPMLAGVDDFVRSHHERWDGKGYPEGLANDRIPIGARLLAVVDCYDALLSDRPYRDKLTRDAALAVLREEAGKSLDPELVETFIALLPSLDQGPTALSTTRRSLGSIVSARREDVALFEISRAISAGLGVEGTARLLAQQLRRVIPYSSVALYLYDTADRCFTTAFADGVDAEQLSSIRVAADAGSFGQSVREQRAVANGTPQTDLDLRAPGAPTRLRSSIVCPLYGEQHDLVGALAVYHVSPDCYTQDEGRLLEMVAGQAGPVVSHALQLARAREEALTDPLTGLPNTRFLWMHLALELARAARQASTLALLLVDVDDFKAVNDKEGHPTGDLALRELAAVLRQSVRPYDVCARYGGDEFLIMLPDCGREEADERLRDLQERIRTHQVTLADGRQFSLRVSIGAAVFPRDGDSSEALLAVADARMYRDKRRWRAGPPGAPPDRFPSLPPTPLRKM